MVSLYEGQCSLGWAKQTTMLHHSEGKIIFFFERFSVTTDFLQGLTETRLCKDYSNACETLVSMF